MIEFHFKHTHCVSLRCSKALSAAVCAEKALQRRVELLLPREAGQRELKLAQAPFSPAGFLVNVVIYFAPRCFHFEFGSTIVLLIWKSKLTEKQ